ncbi:hypothetical protein CYLTODRAFT_418312 [Cylindrobasidium torrendii FP15055 ss-10]|uniref:Uncharacterized protein n=1 Tax=Cylindrobasidium torrendii FP15055 ss-10 TaxID=1314674 RepID=A0A0D7BMZ5_9AGAR|nr:hypothetical protein CYLTODRAFT_418312 [Cylindrobasidium torrendii FP15055 ss-10]
MALEYIPALFVQSLDAKYQAMCNEFPGEVQAILAPYEDLLDDFDMDEFEKDAQKHVRYDLAELCKKVEGALEKLFKEWSAQNENKQAEKLEEIRREMEQRSTRKRERQEAEKKRLEMERKEREEKERKEKEQQESERKERQERERKELQERERKEQREKERKERDREERNAREDNDSDEVVARMVTRTSIKRGRVSRTFVRGKRQSPVDGDESEDVEQDKPVAKRLKRSRSVLSDTLSTPEPPSGRIVRYEGIYDYDDEVGDEGEWEEEEDERTQTPSDKRNAARIRKGKKTLAEKVKAAKMSTTVGKPVDEHMVAMAWVRRQKPWTKDAPTAQGHVRLSRRSVRDLNLLMNAMMKETELYEFETDESDSGVELGDGEY